MQVGFEAYVVLRTTASKVESQTNAGGFRGLCRPPDHRFQKSSSLGKPKCCRPQMARSPDFQEYASKTSLK